MGRFLDVWRKIERARMPDGRFTGQPMGERDSWAADPDITWFGAADAEALFEGWVMERFDEDEGRRIVLRAETLTYSTRALAGIPPPPKPAS